jgi:rhomboid family GlyGly-CTERM serine protease
VDAPQSPELKRRVPVVTLLMLSGAVMVALMPRMSAWLIYDRSAILSGQFWRLFTGHWVHFSIAHLVWDAIPLGIAGWIIESRGWPRFGWFCLLTPWMISAAALIFEPHMSFCGGLSGMATAMITLLVLDGLSDAPTWRWVCVAALLALVTKICFELATGHGLFVSGNGVPAVVSVTNHATGAIAALAFYGQSKWSLRIGNAPTAGGAQNV